MKSQDTGSARQYPVRGRKRARAPYRVREQKRRVPVVVDVYIYRTCIGIGGRNGEREKKLCERQREETIEGWRVVGGGTQPAWRPKGEKEKRKGVEEDRGRRGERRVQLRVGRRSVCQSFVWTSRLTRLIVYSRSGIRVYA